MQENRRSVLKSAVAAMAGAGAAQAQISWSNQEGALHGRQEAHETPMFSSAVSYGNLLFIARNWRACRPVRNQSSY